MPKLPRLSGKQVMNILKKKGFVVKRQKGSHVILVRELGDKKDIVVVPIHKELDRGTLLEIIRQSKTRKEDYLKN